MRAFSALRPLTVASRPAAAAAEDDYPDDFDDDGADGGAAEVPPALPEPSDALELAQLCDHLEALVAFILRVRVRVCVCARARAGVCVRAMCGGCACPGVSRCGPPLRARVLGSPEVASVGRIGSVTEPRMVHSAAASGCSLMSH